MTRRSARSGFRTEGEILYAVKNDGGWEVETVGEIAAFSESNARRNSGLAFDSQGRAHVVFSDTSAGWYSMRGDNGMTNRAWPG